MAKKAAPIEPHFEVYALGICCASVCTTLTNPAEIARQMNLAHPTGIRSRWVWSKDKTFHTGQANPCRCIEHPDRQHWLLNC